MKNTVKLYSKPDCRQCMATERRLKANGVKFEYIDMSTDAEALAEVKALGYLQAPVVVTDTDHWSGFRPDKLDNL